jgi:uracil-DNA glycosylase
MGPLRTEVLACELCVPHLPSGPRPLLQVSERVWILVICQAPGRGAHESGVPWDDKSGDRLAIGSA